jgi:hypothetical protein
VLARGGLGQDLPSFLKEIIAEYSVSESSDASLVEIWQHEYEEKPYSICLCLELIVATD